jgi:asparagine synthase (glutamine-hydrolysing)
MCGIAAWFGCGAFDPTPLLHELAPRGPDARGAWASPEAERGGRVHLVHTRLAILDLSAVANQPMALVRSAGGQLETVPVASAADYVVAYNGEIYNFATLRAELQSRGHAFSSSGDTEVLLRGYAEWGTRVFAKADGMFAVAIYDARARRLVVARDHLGIKPLYYARTRDGGLLFASQVRAIARSGLWSGEINRAALLDYLRFGSFQEPDTAYAGIWAFEPGCVGVIDLAEGVPSIVRRETFWSVENLARVPPPLDWRTEHERRLRQAVEEQLVADVPVGVFLSGGLDSTLLLELAAAHARERLTAFTVGGELATHDETEIAARTAANLRVKHTVVRPTLAQRDIWTRDALAAMDQPTCDGLNTYVVSRAARDAGLVVALGGTGADELHGAYGHARSLARLIRWQRRGGRVVEALLPRVLGWRRGPLVRERLALMLAQVDAPWRVAQEKRRYFTPSKIAELWPESAALPERWHPPFDDEEAFDVVPIETQITLAELRGYLRNTLLRDSDWATMGNRQELRVPYLGRRYVELMLSLPSEVSAASGGVKKPLLAELISPANRALLALPKKGFFVNYSGLLLGPFREDFRQACAWLNTHAGFCLKPDEALRELEAGASSTRSNRLWALLALGYVFSRS